MLSTTGVCNHVMTVFLEKAEQIMWKEQADKLQLF
jgi:hypothetical protein